MHKTSIEILSTTCSFQGTWVEFLHRLFLWHYSGSSGPNLCSGSNFDARPSCPGPSSISKVGDTSPLWVTNIWERFWQRHLNYHIIHTKAKGAKNTESFGTKYGFYTLKPGLVIGVSIHPGTSQCAGRQLGLSKTEKCDFPTSHSLC